MTNQPTPNKDALMQFLKVIGIIILLLLIVITLGRFVFSRLVPSRSSSPTPESQPLVNQQSPQVLIETLTPSDQQLQAQELQMKVPSFSVGSLWLPYRCTADEPTKCVFIQQEDSSVGYWAQCIDPLKYRPTYIYADPYGVPLYQLQEDGKLHPVDEKSNLQTFEFLSQEEEQK